MKLEQIEPRMEGKFVRGYALHYQMENGKEKIYEMVSRTPVQAAADLCDSAPEGVVLIVLSPDKSKVLLNREFRPAVAKIVYNFPAGLIDAGETAETAAERELWEETGLTLLQKIAVYGRSYGAVGLSNESSVVCVGLAPDDVPFGGRADPQEEIEPVWVTKSAARDILQSGHITARVQLFLAMWATEDFA